VTVCSLSCTSLNRWAANSESARVAIFTGPNYVLSVRSHCRQRLPGGPRTLAKREPKLLRAGLRAMSSTRLVDAGRGPILPRSRHARTRA